MKNIALAFLTTMMTAQAADHQRHSFERVQLTNRYYSEGINAADIDGDGVMDVIHGPFWFAGPDFAIVQLALDGKDLGAPLDLYQFAKVGTTGVLEHKPASLTSGSHKLTIRITGTNPNAVQNRFVGLDYVRLVKSE